MTADFTTVTELTGNKVTHEQISRMYARYHFASELCRGKEVLEAACGSGQGLGYLARDAKLVVGGDYDAQIVRCAKDYYKDRIHIEQIDAHDLPFHNESFDVVILFEAIYYLSQPEKFISEAYRVLRKKGVLIICTANKEWPGFNPSPYSSMYFSARELSSLMQMNGFNNIKLYCSCPAGNDNISGKIITSIKKTAVALHLIPETMKGKEFLKRIFMGRLSPLPPEIRDGMAEYAPPVPVPLDSTVRDYKVVYALAFK